MSLKEGYKPEIKVGNGSIKFTLAGAVFKVRLDHRGVPHFTESLRQRLPSYMPELVCFKMRQNRDPHQGWTYLEHAVWCAKMRKLGLCNCVPSTVKKGMYTNGGMFGTLSCALCNARTTGEIIYGLITYGDDDVEAYECLSTKHPKDKGYLACSETICTDCVEMIWENLGVEFVDDAESSTPRFLISNRMTFC